MNYNDDNTHLSEKDWNSMAEEYEYAENIKTSISTDAIASLYRLFYELENSLPTLNSLFNFKTSLMKLFPSSKINIPQKSMFYSTPITTLSREVCDNIKMLSPFLLSLKEEIQKNQINSLIMSLADVGIEINSRKNRRW